jgi:phosphoadenosine phosphosulfate reductase
VVCHKPEDSIYNIAVKRKFLLPSRIIRWCCAELKEKGGAGMVVLTGIRHAEGSRRSKRKAVEVSNRSFAGDLSDFEIYQREQISKKIRHLNKDQFAQQGETEVRCLNGKDKIIINPIIDWTDRDVWDFLNGMKIGHCELYDRGWERIGCICCPMSSYSHKIKELKQYPHVKRNWIKTIKIIRQDENIKNMLTLNHFGDGTEDEICENIFNWWISGKAYSQWYAERFIQQKINFNDDEPEL